MKRIRTLIASLLLMVLGFTVQAQAYPSLELGVNKVTFDGLESGFVSTWSPGQSLIGNVFAGMLKVNNIYKPSGAEYGFGNGGEFLHALFAMKVTGYNQATETYTLGAYQQDKTSSLVNGSLGAFASIFGNNTNGDVIKVYNDNQPYSVNPALPISNTTIANIASGTLWASFGMTWGDVMTNTVTNLNPFANPENPDVFAQFKYKLRNDYYIGENNNFNVVLADGTLGLKWAAPNSPLNSTLWQITASGANNNIVAATPEPATMLIMGSGLLGLYGIRRRQKKA